MTTSDQHQPHDADGISEDRQQKPPAYFNILFFGLILWGVIFMAYYLFSGWSSDAEFQTKMKAHQEQAAKAIAASPSATPAAIDPDAGAKLYASQCAMCHGSQGEGGIGPALNHADYSYGRSEAAIRQSIAKGRPNGMPGFGGQLASNDLDNLTAFILNLK